MHEYQREFIELMLQREVLRFGEFTLKSGRVSPYFFNLGRLDSGIALARVGEAYAQALTQSGLSVDMLFGPAYKGIPLAAATAIALATQHRRDAPLAGRVLIVDDVMTAGTAVRESLALIRAQGAAPAGILIALDRQERGQGKRSAAQEMADDEGVPVIAIATLADILTFAGSRGELAATHAALLAYRAQYGA